MICRYCFQLCFRLRYQWGPRKSGAPGLCWWC